MKEKPQMLAIVKHVERVFDGFLSIDRAKVSYSTFDGGRHTATRFSVERGNSVAIAAVNWDKDSILLVEQFRYPTVAKTSGWTIELPSGSIDSGEAPEQAARRELKEEAGISVSELLEIGTFYLSPGGTSEQMTLFYTDLSDQSVKVIGRGGGTGPGEDIRLVEENLSKFISHSRSGMWDDAKTLVAGLWLATNREELLEKRSPVFLGSKP